MNIKRVRILLFIAVLGIMCLPSPAAAVTGVQANSGTISAYNFVSFPDTYDSSVYTVSYSSSYGDLYVRGDDNGPIGVNLVFYCFIKIKPADSSHKYLTLKVNSYFDYGMSTGWASYASWQMEYIMSFCEQSPPVTRATARFFAAGVGILPMDQLNDQRYNTPSTEYLFYNGLMPYQFGTDTWYYVGVKLTISLTGWADFYKDGFLTGNAHFNPFYMTFEFHDQVPS